MTTNRQVYKDQHLSEASRSGAGTGTYEARCQVVYTPDADKNYVYIMSAAIQQSTNQSSDFMARLYNTTGSVNLAELNIEPKDSTDYLRVFAIARESFGASPATQTVELQYAAETDGNAIAIKEATLHVIRQESADRYAESLGNSTTTSSSDSTKLSLTDTFAAGDYIVIATAESNPGNTSTGHEIHVDVDGAGHNYGTTVYGDSGDEGLRPRDATNYYPFAIAFKVTLSGASHTINLKHNRRHGSGTCTIRNARIWMLDVADLPGVTYAENLTEADDTQSSYQDHSTLTATPAAGDHLLIASYPGISWGSSSSVSGRWKVIEDSTDLATSEIECLASDTRNNNVWQAAAFTRTLNGASHTWKTQRASETSSINTGIWESELILIQLSAAAVGVSPALARRRSSLICR